MTHERRSACCNTVALIIAAACLWVNQTAWCADGPIPYKLGTFERDHKVFLGLVLRDTQVVAIDRANAAYERRNSSVRKMHPPVDMKKLIATYQSGWRDRLQTIARAEFSAPTVADYTYTLDTLRILPPVAPTVVLNANSNYQEHIDAIRKLRAAKGRPAPVPADPKSIPGIWERKPGDTRPNPNVFLKTPAIITGANDPIFVPQGRNLIDWECEFDVVIGRTSRFVPVDNANDYIFGYTIQIDVSDRDRTGVADGVDWTIMKNHDTFAPLGPVIVPKEFLSQPMNVRQTFKLNGEVMQDSSTRHMTHTVFELLSYGSNILTLHAGDVISAGSPAGTNDERLEPRWMRAGDTAVCSIEGIGTQTHPIVNEPTADR